MHILELAVYKCTFREACVHVIQASSKPEAAADRSPSSKANAAASRSLPAEAHHR